MKKNIRKDLIKRIKFNLNEKKHKMLKFLTNTIKKEQLKKKIFYILYTFKNISYTKIQNRCIESGRARGVFRKFKLSRMFLKKYSSSLILPGLKKRNN